MMTHDENNGGNISIHAPSRERPLILLILRVQKNFNPRSLAGATPARQVAVFIYSVFQSTLPRGSDCNPNTYSLVGALFQSTLPRGSDPVSLLMA